MIPAFPARDSPDASTDVVDGKLDKFEAPLETLRRTEATHGWIKCKQFVAEAEMLPCDLVTRRQPQRSLEIPLCRAIVA